MGMSAYNACLLVSALSFLIVDIILALLVRIVLPPYFTPYTKGGWYHANDHALPFDEAVNICPCLRNVFPQGTDTHIHFKKISKRSVDYDPQLQRMEKYAYLVSLSIPSYHDDTEEKMFACNGLVQSNEWLLTTKNCVKDDSEWFDLSVRSESAFWSTLGQEHSVIDIANTIDGNLIQLKVRPKFSENIVPFPPIKYAYGGRWTYAISLGWDGNTCKKKLFSRYKHKPFEIQEWTVKNVTSNSTRVCSKIVDSCKRASSTFLLTSCHQLIGLKMTGSKHCNGFLELGSNFNTDENDECYPIYQDMHTSRAVEDCQT